MSAETLRKAAALMRVRAAAATPSPWEPHVRSVTEEALHPHVGWISTARNKTTVVENAWDGDVLHLASWHPAVAHAVADWLEVIAARADEITDSLPKAGPSIVARNLHGYTHALAVATAYLGSDA